ncbi:MAG: translocation/assembly module TamB domain-containing protein, partial [Chitinophagales bacterium]
NIASDSQSLRYNLALDALDNGEYKILNPAIAGKVQNDSAGIHLTIQDEEKKLKYLLAGNLGMQDQNYRFHFIPDSVTLNYQPWSVTPDNFLLFGKDVIYANNVELSNGGQLIKLNSTGSETNDPPLEITFNDFNIEELTRMVQANEIVAGGLINGNVLVKNLQSTPVFNADLTIDNFSFKEDTLGTITAKANNETADTYTAIITIKGEGNDIAVDGFYSAAQKENALNFDVALNNVNLATLEAYTFGQATRLKGSLKGNLKVQGSTASPDLNGKLTFQDAGFNVTYINSYYKLENEEIVFQNTRATFPNFRLTDTLGNAAVITGWVAPDPKETVAFDLTVESNDFMAINSSRNDTSQFKGRAILDSHIKITGTKDLPKINANIKLDDGSALSITRPKEKVTNQESRGVVIFVNRNDTLHPIMTRIKTDTAAGPSSSIQGLDISANIEVNKYSSLAIVIDPASGDSLQVFGDATLNFTMDPSGKTSLTGRYEISEGSYRLSFYDFVKKKFILKEGSITWNGDPMEADVDLTALYEVRTSPIDLVADQLTGLSDQDKNMYQQRLPFQLYMYMKGELLKPEITFSLDLPPNERGALNGSVYAKLNQLNENESDLNKQVFALLVLNRFIAQDPLESSQNNDVANVARNSVSQLLSQQLNRLAGNYIKGVELNINLQSYEDYSSGEPQGRTELELGVSKQFLNNRLNVQVGGNIDLEGEKVKENNISSITGDISGEYKITPEGVYRLRFYRRNDYDILQGEIIESALGFVFTKDYDRERELFHRSKEEKMKKGKNDSKSDGVKPPPEQ